MTGLVVKGSMPPLSKAGKEDLNAQKGSEFLRVREIQDWIPQPKRKASPLSDGRDDRAVDIAGGAGLVSGAVLDPDGSTDKAEGGPDLVFQKALVREMQFHFPVGKQDEGRRCNRRLG